MSIEGVRHERGNLLGGGAERRMLHQRALANGFGTAMGTATELALLPGIFGTLGWWLDGRWGTGPVFLVGFLVFAFAGMLIKAWLDYDRSMKAEEAKMRGRVMMKPSVVAKNRAADGKDLAP